MNNVLTQSGIKNILNIQMDLQSKIETIHKLTRPQRAAFNKLGVYTAKDALLFFPFRYLDFSQSKAIAELIAGENVSVKATVKSISSRFSFRGRISLCEALVSDGTGNLKVTWFNQSYIAKVLQKGEEIYLAGSPEIYNNILQLTNPIYEKVSGEDSIHTSRLVPIYHLTKNLYQKTIRNVIKSCLPLADQLEDIIPDTITKSEGLMSYKESITQLHFPENMEKFGEAQKRQNFEEIFFTQLLAQKQKLLNEQKGAFPIPFDQELIKTFVSGLPFELTAEQKKAAWDILQDMEKSSPMNRLLEGDVGSGKTLVSFIAALQAIQKGLQVALLCPTEVLAKQHHESALKYLVEKKPFFNCRSILYTQTYSLINRKEKTKKELLQELQDGMPGLYIGTHALLEEKVNFKKLALVIIDEQHRFGVEQRGTLLRGFHADPTKKRSHADNDSVTHKVPHLLSMSATPIPRTLKLAFVGELDISQIRQKPAERKPIITKLVTDENRNKAYEFIKEQIQKGRQAFVITPLIEENETSDIKSAKTEVLNLQKIFAELSQKPPSSPFTASFPSLEGSGQALPAEALAKAGGVLIGLLHGKMKSKEKEQVMQDFLDNKIQILVSTSVVEVGVDVPNASVMVIEGAERFGLSQLHQFRGRVGRAEHQSYCFLFTTENSITPKPPLTLRGGEIAETPSFSKRGPGRVIVQNESLDRLTSFTKTRNGFELAEIDLKQRGFGKLFGETQSGFDYKYFNPDYIALIPKARQEARKLLEDDLELKNYPLLQQKLKGQAVHFE